MKHLVLGSEGLIGKYVCEELERRGEEVVRWDVALDRLHDLSRDDYVPELYFAMSRCDFVHFLAFNVGGSRYLAERQHSYEYLEYNIKLMRHTFGVLKELEKPFYFASSQMSNMVESPYGQLKALGESYTRALHGQIVKFWNVYGYESDPEKSHVITDFIKMMYEKGQIYCRTDGQEERHFTHGRVAAKMLCNLAEKQLSNYLAETKVHNIVDREEHWIRMDRLAELIYMLFTDPLWQPGVYSDVRQDVSANIFFSKKKDTTQTIVNDYEDYHRTPLEDNVVNVKLRDGIRELIKQIGHEYGVD